MKILKALICLAAFPVLAVAQVSTSNDQFVVKQATCSVKLNNKLVKSVQLVSEIRELNVVGYSLSDGSHGEVHFLINDGGIEITPFTKRSNVVAIYSSPNKVVQLSETADDDILSECTLVLAKKLD